MLALSRSQSLYSSLWEITLRVAFYGILHSKKELLHFRHILRSAGVRFNVGSVQMLSFHRSYHTPNAGRTNRTILPSLPHSPFEAMVMKELGSKYDWAALAEVNIELAREIEQFDIVFEALSDEIGPLHHRPPPLPSTHAREHRRRMLGRVGRRPW